MNKKNPYLTPHFMLGCPATWWDVAIGFVMGLIALSVLIGIIGGWIALISWIVR